MAGFGFLFGALFGLGTCYWIVNLENISYLGFLLWQVAFSLYFLLFGCTYRYLSRRISSWIIIGGPALWVSLEYIRANLFFLSCPWVLLGHSQSNFIPVIQIADLGGVYCISFYLVMVNQVLSQLLEYLLLHRSEYPDLHPNGGEISWRRQAIIAFLATTFIFFYGMDMETAKGIRSSIRVAIVQANVLVDDGMSIDQMETHLQVYDKLTKEAAEHKADLIVWPATSLPAPIKTNRFVGYMVRNLAKAVGTYLLVGGAGYEKVAPKKKGYLPFSNSEFLLTPAGRIAGQYNKMHLLAFNEYVPLQSKIKWPKWITTLQESFLPGEEYTLFDVEGIKFGTPICSENLYSDHFRRFVKKGAQFMVSASNEGFLEHTVAPYQTLAMTVFRAVENKVAVVRATTTGISGFINPNGKIVAKIADERGMDISVAGVLVENIPLRDKYTFYTKYGDIFSFMCIGLTVFFAICSLLKNMKSFFKRKISP